MPSIAEGVSIGPYRIETILPEHQGGFAQVVLARRRSSDGAGERVAVKIAKRDDGSDDTFSRSLGNEVETLRLLKHPGIVRLYPIRIDDRHFAHMARALEISGKPWYFVMEYLEGGSVEKLIERRGALSPLLAVEIAHQVGLALDYLHTQNFAHLDIKTSNILLRRPLLDGNAPEGVLVDFGAAQKLVRRAEVEAGALVYLPPERVEIMLANKAPETPFDKRAADIYSLGVTLYRMLTGDLPFRGRRSTVVSAILHDIPTQPLHLNPSLQAFPDLSVLVMQMMEKRPDRRPPIKEVLARLDQIVPPPRFNGSPGQKTLPPQGRRAWRTIALIALFVAILEAFALAFVWFGSQGMVLPGGPVAGLAPIAQACGGMAAAGNDTSAVCWQLASTVGAFYDGD